MGWFLTRGSSKGKGKGKGKAKARTAGKAGEPRFHWNPQRTLLGLKLLTAAAAVTAVVVGWHKGESFLSGYVATERAGAVSPEQVELVDAPAWLDGALADGLRRLVASQVTENPLDHLSLRAAGLALAANPWVADVERVQRLSGDRIMVEASYRAPIAVFEGRDGCHLVDGEGVRLLGPFPRAQYDPLGLPMVVGLARAPGRTGEVWPGEDVQAALALARLLAPQPYVGQVRAIDVSGRDARGRISLTLVTDRGSIRWGLPPGQERPVEPDAAAKLRSLTSLWAQKNRSIDLPGRVADLRISSDAVIIEPAVHAR